MFIAEAGAAAVTTLTIDSTGTPGTPTLNALPAGYEDLGWLDDSTGAVFSDAITTSDVTSWGNIAPNRRDITADVDTLHIICQETKLATIAAATGTDPTTITPDATTGEVSVSKLARPLTRYHRLFSLGVDLGDAGEIYVAQFWPRASLSDRGDQTYDASTGVWWDTTWTAFQDATLGYAVRFMFGGPGWQALLSDMGWTA